MQQDVTHWVEHCFSCAGRNGQGRFWLPPLQNLMVPERIHQLVAVDLVKMPPSTEGNKYILVATDGLTRFARAAPLKDKSAAVVAEALFTKVFDPHGPPEILQTDKGREFVNELLQSVCASYGVDTLHTSTFRPQSNGVAERFNRTLVDYLSKTQHKAKDWDKRLPFFVQAYNGMEHRALGMSPHRAHYGWDMRRVSGNLLDALPNPYEEETREPHKIHAQNLHILAEARQSLFFFFFFFFVLRAMFAYRSSTFG